MSNVSAALKRNVRERAKYCCEYCLVPDPEAPFAKHHIDHITAIQHGGDDDLDNLALACINCNLFKGPNLTSKDPETGQITPFFNPRTQIWTEHFIAFPREIATAISRASGREKKPRRLVWGNDSWNCY